MTDKYKGQPPGRMFSPTALKQFRDPGMDKAVFNEYIANVALSRQALFHKLLDPRRDTNQECGYKETRELTSDVFKDLFDRCEVANRVVELFPQECWQVQPSVYEDEDADVVTEFEEAWDNLPDGLRGKSWYQDEEGNPIWEQLKRLDVLSGIGHFGVMLLGIDDGS